MSNPEEIYVFVGSVYWSENLSTEFPSAISVGNNYRLIQFVRQEEAKRLERASINGITHGKFNATKTIKKMEDQAFGYFVVHGDSNDVHVIVDHFNQAEES